jgi:hypothetical protein
VQRRAGWQHKTGMTGDSRSDSELLAGLPRQPELMGGSTVMYVTQGPATSEPKLAGSGTAPSVRPSSTPTTAASAAAKL